MLKRFVKKYYAKLIKDLTKEDDTQLLALGTLLSNQQWAIPSDFLNDFEFKIFSQFGDDGIIQYLIKHLPIPNPTFIEFGVEDYLESTTRFLMVNNGWSGFVLDSSEQHLKKLQNQSWFWKYDLRCKTAFITRENINYLMEETGLSEIGLLHIDIDGNDYHVLEALDLNRLNPCILIVEYNSVFGTNRAIAIPYRPDFDRVKSHFSKLYFGASLPAFQYLGEKKGYALIGSNRAGNNAYFVRKDLLNEKIKSYPAEAVYQISHFKESCNENGSASNLAGESRLRIIQGMEVINVRTSEIEKL
jgi:hypothetical protein